MGQEIHFNMKNIYITDISISGVELGQKIQFYFIPFSSKNEIFRPKSTQPESKLYIPLLHAFCETQSKRSVQVQG